LPFGVRTTVPGGRMIGIAGMKDSLAIDPSWIPVQRAIVE
jgi:hypothetical protein